MTLFFLLVPVWNSFMNAVIPTGNAVITDTTFLNTWNVLPGNINIIIQWTYPLIVVGLGLYLFLIPFRTEPTQEVS